jgi:ribosomal protein S18 acetylase RimI-like enzyme
VKPLADLSPADVDLLGALAGDHPAFRVYLAAGLEACRRGETNRTALIGRARQGAALGIAFDGVEVRTSMGRLAPDEELTLADARSAAELHLDEGMADRLTAALGERITGRHSLRHYRLDGRPRRPPDPRCRTLGRSDLAIVAALFGAHYPAAIFSEWMLDQPFLGLFEAGDLIACGGVVALADGIANVGNFLTRPDTRGRGLAQAVAVTLAHRLADGGVATVTLGTAEENIPACRAYEAVGFRCFDRRAHLGIAAAE